LSAIKVEIFIEGLLHLIAYTYIPNRYLFCKGHLNIINKKPIFISRFFVDLIKILHPMVPKRVETLTIDK